MSRWKKLYGVADTIAVNIFFAETASGAFIGTNDFEISKPHILDYWQRGKQLHSLVVTSTTVSIPSIMTKLLLENKNFFC